MLAFNLPLLKLFSKPASNLINLRTCWRKASRTFIGDIIRYTEVIMRSKGLFYSLIASNAVSVLLFLIRIAGTNSDRYYFLFWNLALAWVPLWLAILLNNRLKSKSWKDPAQVLLTLLWLGFLPNSFYIISDLVHLQNTGEVGILFDAALFMSIIFNALIAGMMSVYLVHKQLIKRIPSDIAYLVVGLVFLLVSFAIYLGRILRWNTWDILANPAGLVFDLSDNLVKPLDHPQVLVTTLTFFLLLGSMYFVVWQLAAFLTAKKR